MSTDAVSVLECIFQTVWSLFTCFDIPGTNVTPAMWALFILCAGFGLRFFLSFSHSMPSANTTSDLSRSVSSRMTKREVSASKSKSSSDSYKARHPEVFGK